MGGLEVHQVWFKNVLLENVRCEKKINRANHLNKSVNTNNYLQPQH